MHVRNKDEVNRRLCIDCALARRKCQAAYIARANWRQAVLEGVKQVAAGFERDVDIDFLRVACRRRGPSTDAKWADLPVNSARRPQQIREQLCRQLDGPQYGALPTKPSRLRLR